MRLLVLSREFPPIWTPLAKRVAAIVKRLGEAYEVDVITGTRGTATFERCTIHRLAEADTTPSPTGWVSRLRAEVDEWSLWPLSDRKWAERARAVALSLARKRDYGCVIGFMMPYIVGRCALAVKDELGIPLLLSLNDSPTCSDMHPHFRTRFHKLAVHRMEEAMVRRADAVVYVSAHNAARIAAAVGKSHARKIHLIRVGPFERPILADKTDPATITILYLGDFSGWHRWIDDHRGSSWFRKLYRSIKSAGRYAVTTLDVRAHAPVYLARAIQRAVARNPAWTGRIRLRVVGNSYARVTVERTLELTGIRDVVSVEDRIPAAAALEAMNTADALFLCLPDRTDGSYGGRVSAKVYDYLLTSKPIIASLPKGENRDLLSRVPGVYLTGPSDVDAMSDVLCRLAEQKFGGGGITSFDRAAFHDLCDGNKRVCEFVSLVEAVMRSRKASP